MKKSKIITTSDLFRQPKAKKKESKLLTTKDLPDVLPIQEKEKEENGKQRH